MFDVQYAGRFGKKEETPRELTNILHGIADKLIYEMDIINEYIKLRSVEAHEKYGAEKEERAYYTSNSMLHIREMAASYMYDKDVVEKRDKNSELYKIEKDKKTECQNLCNSAGILIMQLDNIVEEIASRAYESAFSKDPHKYYYREASEDLGFSKQYISKVIIAMRTSRNGFCHSTNFVEHFENMTVGKIVHLKNMVMSLVYVGHYFNFSYRIHTEEETKLKPFYLNTKIKNKSIFVKKI